MMKRSILCGTRMSAFIGLPSLDARQLQRDREAEIGNERERMRRIDRERRQHRKDVMQEMVFEPGALLFGDVRRRRSARCRAGSARRAVRASAPAGRSRGPTPSRRCAASCSDGVSPSGLRSVMPSRTWPLSAATRTMKNSSRLLAEIDRKRSRSSSGWLSLAASSSTRRLKCSHDNSRLMKRSGLLPSVVRSAASGCTPEADSIGRTMASLRLAMD